MSPRLTITFLFILYIYNIFAQSGTPNNYTAETVIPKSPDVASFTKYGQYPTDLSTGLVKIDIPIYTIETGQLKLPISLSYHASGIKVDEIAGSVGLGWTLNAGGSLSIQTKGRPDNISSYYKSPKAEELIQGADDPIHFRNKLSDLCYTADTQSDIYSYNVSGNISGSFIYDNTLKIKSIPLTDNKITVSTNGYTITSTNGTNYFFENVCSKTSFGQEYAKTAYYLTKILSADKRDSIILTYEQLPLYFDFNVNFSANKTRSLDNNSLKYTTMKSYSSTGYIDFVLSKIIFNGGKSFSCHKKIVKIKGRFV